MTAPLEPRAIGRDRARQDGPAKLAGNAPYAYEVPADNPAYGALVQASVARGRITAVDTGEAERVPGVLAVLTPFRAERLASTEDAELAVLQDEQIAFRGQIVGIAVAETSEAARRAAELVSVRYEPQPHDVALSADRCDLYAPEKVNPSYPTDVIEGDVEQAMRRAPASVDETYATPMVHNNPMEPHATVALWSGGKLTLWDSTQGVHPAREAVREVFGLDAQRVRVVSPYVGGGFGS